jgi:hypothetical protein
VRLRQAESHAELLPEYSVLRRRRQRNLAALQFADDRLRFIDAHTCTLHASLCGDQALLRTLQSHLQGFLRFSSRYLRLFGAACARSAGAGGRVLAPLEICKMRSLTCTNSPAFTMTREIWPARGARPTTSTDGCKRPRSKVVPEL